MALNFYPDNAGTIKDLVGLPALIAERIEEALQDAVRHVENVRLLLKAVEDAAVEVNRRDEPENTIVAMPRETWDALMDAFGVAR